MCLREQVAGRPLRHSVNIARGILRVRTWSLARHLLPDSSATSEPSDTRKARAKCSGKGIVDRTWHEA